MDETRVPHQPPEGFACHEECSCEHCCRLIDALEKEQAGWLECTKMRLATEAARDHAVRELTLQQGSFAAVIAERDQARADNDDLLQELTEARADAKQQVARVAHQWAESQAQLAAVEQRATRLAALEVAARAWAKTDWDTDEGQEACAVLTEAVHALDAAPAPQAGP